MICAEDLMVGGQLWGLGQLGGQGVDPLRHPAGGSVVRLNHRGRVERQVKVLIKNLAILFLFPSKEFLPISFKIQLFVCLLCH
jgi:hypothetical protein